MNSTQCPELSFYTDDLYWNMIGYNVKKQLILFYWKLSDKSCDDVILISISNACMPEFRKLIPCTFNGDL